MPLVSIYAFAVKFKYAFYNAVTFSKGCKSEYINMHWRGTLLAIRTQKKIRRGNGMA